MPPGEGKRVAPISSSAFSFSLNTPAKKPKLAQPTTFATYPPQRQDKAAETTPAAAPADSRTPLRTPISALSLVTPTRPSARDASSSKPTRLETLPSPFGMSPKSARPQKRLTSVLDDPSSPFRLGSSKPRPEERKDLQGITAMPRLDVTEMRQQARVEAEEGIGVSPRRHKGAIQHKGSGPPPSVRLANLVSSANTSLVLFYTSLQQTLYPSTRAVRSPHACLNHIRTAPIRLQVTSTISGPTHQAVMATCAVLHWATEPAPSSVLVVFQALPSDCPKLGLDPRLLAASPDKVFEVGVLAPWSETSMPSVEEEEGGAVVLFASRYLVAEREGGRE